MLAPSHHKAEHPPTPVALYVEYLDCPAPNLPSACPLRVGVAFAAIWDAFQLSTNSTQHTVWPCMCQRPCMCPEPQRKHGCWLPGEASCSNTSVCTLLRAHNLEGTVSQ
jgi:hypothetical protein